MMEILTMAWAWVVEYPSATVAVCVAVAELYTRLRKTKDSAGFIKRFGAGVDIILDIVRFPNRLK